MKKYYLIIFALFALNCAPKVFKTKWTKEVAPDSYTARFETTKGKFDIKITRKLSPKAADRFYQFVKYRYFDQGIFYRVNPGFVAQFGSSDTLRYRKWDAIKLPDELVVQGNTKGTLSFGRGGKETRATELFINLEDNIRLDTIDYAGVKGFPTFGIVTNGMDVVESLYSGYADTTMDTLDLMYLNRVEFLKRFPRLDGIEKAYILH
tara:strand:- start:3508 stop:4128 length:621 start_codon:yes stop_codon:yes gene_type:complete